MELVEVVTHEGMSDETLARARAFCGRINRLPVTVRSAPGFLVNRVLTPYLLEAMLMIEEGTTPATVDRASERFGMAMGPVEVADRVGLDVALEVAESLKGGLDQPLPDVPANIRKLVENGDLGRKTGRGRYERRDGKPRKGEAGETGAEMTGRLILPMVNMAAACLREGIVGDADLLDGAMIFGAGFAPFRGGRAITHGSAGWTTLPGYCRSWRTATVSGSAPIRASTRSPAPELGRHSEQAFEKAIGPSPRS